MAICCERERETLNIGDAVLVTHSTRNIIGVIKYMGPVDDGQGRQALDCVGVELVEPVNDGFDGGNYFTAEMGYGLTIKVSLVRKLNPADLASELKDKNHIIRNLYGRVRSKLARYVNDVFSCVPISSFNPQKRNMPCTLEQSGTSSTLHFDKPITPLSRSHRSRHPFPFPNYPRKNGSSTARASADESVRVLGDDHKSDVTSLPQPSAVPQDVQRRPVLLNNNVPALSAKPSEKPAQSVSRSFATPLPYLSDDDEDTYGSTTDDHALSLSDDGELLPPTLSASPSARSDAPSPTVDSLEAQAATL